MTKELNRRNFLYMSALGLGSMISFPALSKDYLYNKTKKRVGIIGLDTSHAIAFTKSLHEQPERFRHYKVVSAYPYGTKTIPSATERIPKYTEDIKKLGVKIASSIQEMLQQVDVVLLETNDGRLHLEQAEEVFKAGKPVFIDKPLAASYADAAEIFKLAEKYKVPFFSSSSLRYIDGMDKVLSGEYGKVIGADVYTPATLDPSHPDFFWYGIHGVEMLFTAMGIGCQSVSRTHTKDADVIVGVWEDGRIGTVRGKRSGLSDFGGNIFCEKGTIKLGQFSGYDPLLEKIVEFFDTKQVPFDGKETLEICAFIDAADTSKHANGLVTNLPTLK